MDPGIQSYIYAMMTTKHFIMVKQVEGNPESGEYNESFSTDFNEVKILFPACCYLCLSRSL